MSVYLIAQINIADRERYSVYESGLWTSLRSLMKLLSVDESPDILEGDSIYPYGLIEFPSKTAADAWYRSEAYQALAQHRFAASEISS